MRIFYSAPQSLTLSKPLNQRHKHTRTHARTHARTHTHTHTDTNMTSHPCWACRANMPLQMENRLIPAQMLLIEHASKQTNNQGLPISVKETGTEKNSAGNLGKMSLAVCSHRLLSCYRSAERSYTGERVKRETSSVLSVWGETEKGVRGGMKGGSLYEKTIGALKDFPSGISRRH